MATMKAIPIGIARSKFTQLIREVESGEEVVVTRDGQPVARITSEQEARDRERRMAVLSLLEMREEWLAAGIRGEDLYEESRKIRDNRP